LRSRQRLVRVKNSRLDFSFDESRSTPAQRLLAALYAAGQLDPEDRRAVMAAMHQAMRWEGAVGSGLIAHLSGVRSGTTFASFGFDDPVEWAMEILGFGANGFDVTGRRANGSPARPDVQRRFRTMLRDAHPDHGGDVDEAAQRIADLREARRILLA
jgi:hypothetical protein